MSFQHVIQISYLEFLTSERKKGDVTEETREKRIKRKCTDKKNVKELGEAGRDCVAQEGVHHLESRNQDEKEN